MYQSQIATININITLEDNLSLIIFSSEDDALDCAQISNVLPLVKLGSARKYRCSRECMMRSRNRDFAGLTVERLKFSLKGI